MLRALAHDEHVIGRRTDVLGGAIEPVQRLDGIAQVEEGRSAALGVERRAGFQSDDGLPPAGVEAGRRVLEGHRGREAQGVGEGVAPMRVRPQPGAAEGGPEDGGMQRDGEEQSAPPAGDHLHALVREIGQGQGGGHRVPSPAAFWAVL